MTGFSTASRQLPYYTDAAALFVALATTHDSMLLESADIESKKNVRGILNSEALHILLVFNICCCNQQILHPRRMCSASLFWMPRSRSPAAASAYTPRCFLPLGTRCSSA